MARGSEVDGDALAFPVSEPGRLQTRRTAILRFRHTRGHSQLPGKGFLKRYTYDRCAVRNPPPYFPTTGKFTDNRYLELDPVGFNPNTYFLSLLPTGP